MYYTLIMTLAWGIVLMVTMVLSPYTHASGVGAQPPLVPSVGSLSNWDQACESIIVASGNLRVDCGRPSPNGNCSRGKLYTWAEKGVSMKCFARQHDNHTKVFSAYDAWPLESNVAVKKYYSSDEKPRDFRSEGIGQLRRDLHEWEFLNPNSWATFSSGKGIVSDEAMTNYKKVVNRVRAVLGMSSGGDYLPYSYSSEEMKPYLPYLTYSARFVDDQFMKHHCASFASADQFLRGEMPPIEKYNATREYCKDLKGRHLPHEDVAPPDYIKSNTGDMINDLARAINWLAWDFTQVKNPTDAQKAVYNSLIVDIAATWTSVYTYLQVNIPHNKNAPQGRMKITNA